MPEQHALLSASSSHRWLVCTPSAVLESKLPDTAGDAAIEGTEAHALAEHRLKRFLSGSPMKRRPKNVDAEMWEATGRYADICIEKIGEARTASPDAEVHVEQRLNYSRWAPEGFGTGDMVIVSDERIEVVDLKYGKGVRVSAEGNTQMRLYALGLLESYGLLYDAETIRMTIVQPRLDAVSTEEITRADLLAWGETVKEKAALAYKGEGPRVPGEHCRFCRCRATCRALAEYELAGVKEDTRPGDLTDIEIAEIITRMADIKSWLTSVEAFAMGKALDGIEWPGLKLVEGRSTRKITDPLKAAEILEGAGFDHGDVFKPHELQTITKLEKLVGRAKLQELLDGVIEKPPGKPTLVPASDSRPAMELSTATAKDFDDKLL